MPDGYFEPSSDGVVQFTKLIPDGREPKRADRSGAGYLPSRAMRYCDALTSATGFGYWVFPPIDLQFIWDGEQVFWALGESEEWQPLSGTASGAAQFPGFSEQFDKIAPEALRGYAPPFLTALPELGGVQIWTGLLARTKPGWSLLVRPPVNLPGIPGLTAWEGIVETDHWFGPLFSNFRLTRTDFPVRLRSHTPFLQVQPVPQLAYREGTLNQMTCLTVEEMVPSDWSDFSRVVVPDQSDQAQGNYAVRLRKRRACPHHAALLQQSLVDESR